MQHATYPRFWLLRHFVVALAAGIWVAACTASQLPRDEPVATASAALFTNGGFETGTAGQPPPAPWTVRTFLNPGITVQTPQTYAGLNLAAGGIDKTVILYSAGGPGSQPDPSLGASASLRWPRYGNRCALVNQHGNDQNVNILSQTMTVAAADVDPSDGQVHIRFTVAPVLQNPAHTLPEQPYYFVILTDTTKATTLYSDFNLSGAAGTSWQKINAGTPTELDYTDWQLVDISGAGGQIAQGDSVTMQLIGAGCSLGGHFGELYVDGVGATIPGLNVEGAGPAQANAGTNNTYTLTYKNGSTTAETGVTVSLVTPANTTYQSLSASGLSCVAPAVGTAGTVTCTVGNLAAGATGSLTVTFNIATAATGTIVEGDYWSQSTQETALLGPPIVTQIGCTQDAQCSAGFWCDESTNACTAKLSNGTAMPTDPAHMNPTLNGTCTAAAGALVCTSGVCDKADNKCGYANEDGPCTVANGGTVCRSGTCSASGTCEPAGGCDVDADCGTGQWCDETAHMCKAQLENGTSIPTDPAHTNPSIDGMCTTQAGALVCASGVCDTNDNECGYANGDGPCTMANGGTVCRSGACSTNGTCEPAGGCSVNTDCTNPAMPDCNPTTHTCQAPDAGTDGSTDAGGSLADSGSEDSSSSADAEGDTGEVDSSVVNQADASASGDATMGPDSADQGGFVAGGGLSCTLGRASREPPASLGGMLVGVGIVLGARRRRRGCCILSAPVRREPRGRLRSHGPRRSRGGSSTPDAAREAGPAEGGPDGAVVPPTDGGCGG
jgi:hypothetical protein